MNWFDAAIAIMWVMGLIIVTGLYSKLEAKLDALLNLVEALTGPKSLTVPGIYRTDLTAEQVDAMGKPPEEKTVYHLTPEHDAKVLGDDDL